MCACALSCVRLLVTPWIVDHQAPLSMEFSKQEYWSGLLLPSPGDLPNPGIKLVSLVSPSLTGILYQLSHWGKPIITLEMRKPKTGSFQV